MQDAKVAVARRALWIVMALALGCSGEIGMPNGMDDPDDPMGPVDLPPEDPTRPGVVRDCDTFEAVPPRVYAAKVKALLVAAPLTAGELATLQSDPAAFPDMVAGWVDSPDADAKLLDFFATTFQQDGFEEQDLADLIGMDRLHMGRFPDGTNASELFQQSFRESFARIVLDFVREGRSFEDVLSTDEGYYTPAQLLALAYRDDFLHDDADEEYYRSAADRIPSYLLQSHTPTTLEESLDPTSPEFMRFYVDADRHVDLSACAGQELFKARNYVKYVHRAIHGSFHGNGDECNTGRVQTVGEPLLALSDYTEHRRVRIRRPEPGEPTTKFWDLDTLRSADEIVLSIPRVGFFTTPGFFATWPTNDSNQARVTTNQTLIVALGESFDGEDSIVPAFDDALDGEHADPSTACYGCHVNLDPMRQYFRNSFSYYYHEQTDPTVRETRAAFGFHGVEAEGEDVFDLAAILQDHPRFAPSMVQKACYLATNTTCPEGDPAFEEVLASFVDSGLDFRSMLVDLLSSPLVTGAECVVGGGGDLASNARRRHFCANLSKRLGIDNACGTEVVMRSERSNVQNFVAQLVEVVPDDAFSRGGEEPVLITDTNMFLTGANEAICGRLAREVTGDGTDMTREDPDGAIEVMLTRIMGLVEGDPRREPAREILRRHWTAAEEATNATAALQSTFTAACVSPGVTAMGL